MTLLTTILQDSELTGIETAYVPFLPQMSVCDLAEIPLESGSAPAEVFLCGFTLRNTTDEAFDYPILPDTCSSLVFRQAGRRMEGWFCGTADCLRKLRLKQGERFTVLRFRPGNSRVPFIGDLSAVTNRALRLGSDYPEGAGLLEIMEQDLSDEEKVRLLTEALQETRLQKESVQLFRYCTGLIIRTNGSIRISELAANTGFSERYIGKLFERMTGLSPKLYSETIRMQHAVRRIRNREEQKSLLELSMDCGYFDHAHMNREFNKFLKCSAGNLRRKGFAVIDRDLIEPYVDRT